MNHLLGIVASTPSIHYNYNPVHFEQERLYKMNSEFFFSWLAPLFVGLYIAFYSPLVLAKELPLGTFLATISCWALLIGTFSWEQPTHSTRRSHEKRGEILVVSWATIRAQSISLTQALHMVWPKAART